MPESEEDSRKKAEFDTFLEDICQAAWQPYSALQFAVRCLSKAAEKKAAAGKNFKSFANIKVSV